MVGNVSVPRAAIAQLATVLEHQGPDRRLVGYRLGQAIDGNRDSLALSPAEAAAILDVLADHPITELEPLREALRTAPVRGNVNPQSALA